MDVRSVFHPATSIDDLAARGPLIVSSGAGCRVRTADGRELLDAAGGLWCVNVGYGREELAGAAHAAMKELGYYHSFSRASNPAQIRLADRLLRLLAEKAGATHLSRVFFGCTGSDANDTVVKLVRYYNNLRGRPKKKKIISRRQGYHGVSVATASLTGLQAFHDWFDLPIDGVVHVSPTYHYREGRSGESEAAFAGRLAEELEQRILAEGPDTVAAFIAEPVMGAGGVMPPPAGYFEAVQKVLRKYDVLFIADEVICGFGRLGSWFATGHYRLEPDFLTLAKGLTSGYFPLSAVVLSGRVWDVLESEAKRVGTFAHGYTYSGHPVGAAVALANLDIMELERLPENAARVGAYLRQALRERLAGHPNVGDVRGEGLIMAVEFVQDRNTKAPFDASLGMHRRVADQALAHGLIVRPLAANGIVAISPPLTLTQRDADLVVERLATAVRETFQ